MGMCVNGQGPWLDENNGKQSLIMGSNNCQITWYVMLAINKSHCSIIHCKVSKNCNSNANQCKSILESSHKRSRSSNPNMNDSCNRRTRATFKCKCKTQNAKCKIIRKCKWAKCENVSNAEGETRWEGNNQIKINAPPITRKPKIQTATATKAKK